MELLIEMDTRSEDIRRKLVVQKSQEGKNERRRRKKLEEDASGIDPLCEEGWGVKDWSLSSQNDLIPVQSMRKRTKRRYFYMATLLVSLISPKIIVRNEWLKSQSYSREEAGMIEEMRVWEIGKRLGGGGVLVYFKMGLSPSHLLSHRSDQRETVRNEESSFIIHLPGMLSVKETSKKK